MQYASCLAKVWPDYVIFPILFQVWSKILSPISNQALHSTLKTWQEQQTKENAFGLCDIQSVLLKGVF